MAMLNPLRDLDDEKRRSVTDTSIDITDLRRNKDARSIHVECVMDQVEMITMKIVLFYLLSIIYHNFTYPLLVGLSSASVVSNIAKVFLIGMCLYAYTCMFFNFDDIVQNYDRLKMNVKNMISNINYGQTHIFFDLTCCIFIFFIGTEYMRIERILALLLCIYLSGTTAIRLSTDSQSTMYILYIMIGLTSAMMQQMHYSIFGSTFILSNTFAAILIPFITIYLPFYSMEINPRGQKNEFYFMYAIMIVMLARAFVG